MTEEQHAARDLLGYYGWDGGYQPGGFITKLLSCWEVADTDHAARLAVAFPAMGAAVDVLYGGGREALYRFAYPAAA
jgi:hypothetical protein